ncbi:uncharacterized protein FIBRA_02960 [Fibroporia radiculosa]|uniref:DUF7726 domain-containing protein n=1 Tax=Fibroporia radiculosa TaxID=599839 RepID=J4H251_9APHY|nr:uncharacterized protein FIBRA_02960 [Fibroporia radiculosa]CCM00914.1 predicted protein [Fibroporia radiculosa]
MQPKRKSDVLEADAPASAVPLKENAVAKKARVSDAPEGSSSKGQKAKEPAQTKNWREIVLEGEDEDGVPVYDDCNEIRRRIRLLQKQPDFKDIGGINNNSFQRFMKASGPTGGAGNGTYYAAYVYFEKVRIAEGKKTTAKRQRNEMENPGGFPLQDRKAMWVIGPT